MNDYSAPTSSMLLILSASSFRSSLTGRRPSLDLLSLPALAHEEMGLYGLAIPADLLKGWDASKLEQLRRNADKSACPALLLYEPQPQAFHTERKSGLAHDRLVRVFQAAERLGCSSAGFSVQAPNVPALTDSVVDELKRVMETAERLGINMLIQPAPGLTETPDLMTELIKRVGGFRIGSLPDFEMAAASGDANQYLRRLAPYAPVLFGSTVEFDKTGVHTTFGLKPCVEALVEVGYDASIAIDYRGAGDAADGVRRTRDELLRLFEEAKT